MAYNDTTTIGGGPNQQIVDWFYGDDRVFTGTVTGLLASDATVQAAFFTLKLNPNDTDANAIIQKKITTSSATAGIITNSTSLLFHIYSGDYQALVTVGPAYWFDFRVITVLNSTITIATGQVQFQQNVTRTDAAGTPAAAPNNGQPVWRGFIAANPMNYPPFGVFNVGDFYINSVPVVGQPSGWQCIQPGSNGAWASMGITGQTTTFLQGPIGPPGSFTPANPWTFGTAVPSAAPPNPLQTAIQWNLTPTSGLGNSSNAGWLWAVDVQAWKEFGPVGN